MAALPLASTGAKPLSTPPVATRSVAAKSREASDKVMLIVSAPVKVWVVAPLARAMATVGAVVSVLTLNSTMLLTSCVVPVTPLW